MFSPDDEEAVETETPASPPAFQSDTAAARSSNSRHQSLFASPSRLSHPLTASDSMQLVNVEAVGAALGGLSSSDSAHHISSAATDEQQQRPSEAGAGRAEASFSFPLSAADSHPRAVLHPSAPYASVAPPAAASPASAQSISFAIPIAAPIPRPVYKPITPTSSAAAASAPAAAPPSSSSSSSAPSSSSTSTAPPPRSQLIHSAEFVQFKASVPLTRVSVSPSAAWSYYDVGPKAVTALVLLHGTSGTPAVYFHQLLALSARGYRVISASWPPCFTVKDWTASFLAFLDALQLPSVHLLGCSLGGFLSLCFASAQPGRVQSLIIVNGFIDTAPFVKSYLWLQALYWMPEWAIKGHLLQSFPTSSLWPDSVDFVVQQLDSLTALDVSSRLTLNSTQHTVERMDAVDQSRVTVIAPTDEVSLPEEQRERLLAALPQARIALLKQGGDFPMLSVPDELNMFIVVHLRAVGCRADASEQRGRDGVRDSQPSPLDAVKEPLLPSRAPAAAAPAAVSAAPRPPSSAAARPLSSPTKAAPLLFKPERRVLDGGGAQYEAGEEDVDDEEELKRRLQRYKQEVEEKDSKTGSQRLDGLPSRGGGGGLQAAASAAPSQPSASAPASASASPAAREETTAEERRKSDSLRLQAEVESRLRTERQRAEEERRRRVQEEAQRQLEAEKRRNETSTAVLSMLMDGHQTDSAQRSSRQQQQRQQAAGIFDDS